VTGSLGVRCGPGVRGKFSFIVRAGVGIFGEKVWATIVAAPSGRLM
jgi:hypothetical protein